MCVWYVNGAFYTGQSIHDANVSPPVAPKPAGLTIDDLFPVKKYLKDLSHEELIELGIALGLRYPHLRNMSRPILNEMVAAWLNGEDNVLSATGPPSWDSLRQALKGINQPGISLISGWNGMYEARLRSCATCSVNGREEQLWSQSSAVAEEAAVGGKAGGEEAEEKGDKGVQGKEGATSLWPTMLAVLALLTLVLALVLGQVTM